MIESVAYGKNSNGLYYVQKNCNKEHNGEQCECESLGEAFSKQEAQELAKAEANTVGVKVEVW